MIDSTSNPASLPGGWGGWTKSSNPLNTWLGLLAPAMIPEELTAGWDLGNK